MLHWQLIWYQPNGTLVTAQPHDAPDYIDTSSPVSCKTALLQNWLATERPRNPSTMTHVEAGVPNQLSGMPGLS